MSIHQSNIYVYVMAGGEGTRFAPFSTPERPKQFLEIMGYDCLLKQTYDRVHKLTPNVFVGTNIKYSGILQHELPNVKLRNVIYETESKNTAPAISLACWVISGLNPDAVIACLPSDHYIGNETLFLNLLKQACDLANHHDLAVVMGVKPKTPSSAYGYIKAGHGFCDEIRIVERFVEKPNSELANQYFHDSSYFWNSGIFVWNCNTLLNAISKHMPELYVELIKLPKNPTIEQVAVFFDKATKISIDYAIIEKMSNIVVLPSECGWSDIGTWEGLWSLIKNKEINIDNVHCDMVAYMKSKFEA